MRTFFLFYLLTWLLRNPLLALVIVAVVFYAGEARFHGRWFDPSAAFKRRQAIRDLERTLSINPHDVAARNDLGRLLVQAGHIDEAAPHLEKAIARMEESPEANYYHGLCLLHSGNTTEGESAVQRALSINPRFLYGEPQITLARSALETHRAENARRWAEEAVKLNTSSIEGWTLLGKAEQLLGREESARAAFESARDAFAQLPRYLRLPNRKWLAEAKNSLKRLAA